MRGANETARMVGDDARDKEGERDEEETKMKKEREKEKS